jgi:hypothetical protein
MINTSSVVDFYPISTNPIKIILGSNLTVTIRQISIRLNILGCNPVQVPTHCVGNGLNLKNQKFISMDHL